ncbi:hypothetical protein CEXT_211281 [Caerostris extrusa]|uniref:Uncharacterized protein n=1 Tax=Caerostris extrusa TaxID=172846 RepID=A0AAV4NF44_CAEEX|nr:hypothetical protein CEXT_211281 [Caerostris extrusa]
MKSLCVANDLRYDKLQKTIFSLLRRKQYIYLLKTSTNLISLNPKSPLSPEFHNKLFLSTSVAFQRRKKVHSSQSSQSSNARLLMSLFLRCIFVPNHPLS